MSQAPPGSAGEGSGVLLSTRLWLLLLELELPCLLEELERRAAAEGLEPDERFLSL